MADNINEKLQTVRTMEDIVNLLSILFTNLNNQNEMYYDMFLNPVPMDLDLERYDENGNLVVVTLPNVAKMRITAYSGPGNPNGVQAASIGALYIDTTTGNIYYKATGDKTQGWQLVWSSNNLREGIEFLSPRGNASELQNLNMNSAGSGTLSVQYGGTGRNTLSGILKGDGTNPVTTAIVDEDYLAPSSFAGLVMYCPTEVIPDGWLVCDGTIYTITQRPELTRLCAKLGNKYGGNGITTFGVPNLIGKYIKGSIVSEVGGTGGANVGSHSHQYTGSTRVDGSHTHNRGTMNITGSYFYGMDYDVYKPNKAFCGGAFYPTTANADTDNYLSEVVGNVYNHWRGMGFEASRTWVGETSATPHSHSIDITLSSNTGINDVNHIKMIPIIKW